MKKILTALLTTMLIISSLSCVVSADTTGTCGNLSYSISNNEVTITGCNTSASGGLTIPSTIEGYPVTSIGKSAFYNCRNLTSITIPNSVTSIGERAFYCCSSLTSITIPNSVTSIGKSAFYECRNLTSITIPDSVTSIGAGAFDRTAYYNDSNNWENYDFLYIGNHFIRARPANSIYSTSYSIREGTITIAGGACYGCSYLNSITIPNSVTSIGDSAFCNCGRLSRITIPNSVTSIGSCLVSDCGDYLTSITVDINNPNYCSIDGNLYSKDGKTLIEYAGGKTTIPNSVTSIGERAFYGCSSLTSITIPNSVTSIGHEAFYGCSNLTSITIPNSVTSIGDSAFCRCSNLKSITIGNGVTSIGNSEFSWCRSLTSITIPNSVTSIGDESFYKCESLTSIAIPNSVTSIGDSAFSNCSSLKSITIPNSATSIGSSAFYLCSSLTSITIGNGVTSIGNSAFYGCSSLTSITVGVNNPNYCSIDGNLYSKDGKTLIQYAKGKTATSITIPNSVTSIGDSVFSGYSRLKSITIPNSVTSIGSSAFYYCENLTNVYYSGSSSQWGEISIGSGNAYLNDAIFHYNSPLSYYNSGYYSSSLDNTFKEGLIAFTSQVTGYSNYNASDIDSFGMYIYKSGSYTTQLTSASGQDLIDNEGWFYSFVTEIPLANFSNEIHALPYIIVNGETYFGDVISATVDGTNDLGDITTKPSFLQ